MAPRDTDAATSVRSRTRTSLSAAVVSSASAVTEVSSSRYKSASESTPDWHPSGRAGTSRAARPNSVPRSKTVSPDAAIVPAAPSARHRAIDRSCAENRSAVPVPTSAQAGAALQIDMVAVPSSLLCVDVYFGFARSGKLIETPLRPPIDTRAIAFEAQGQPDVPRLRGVEAVKQFY